MKWSFTIMQISGIPIRIHLTFFLLLLFVLLSPASTGFGGPEGLLIVLGVFVGVVIHELGHALTARRYDINTRSITLLPIGGVAALDRMPTKPSGEIVVAAAGPLTSFGLALLLGGIAAGSYFTLGAESYLTHYLSTLAFINGFLGAFNLVPALPMDGGRILRGILASAKGHTWGTEVAGKVGQVVAIGFGVIGLFSGNFFLMLIAVFVYLGANAERQEAELERTLKDIPAWRAMLAPVYWTTPEETLGSLSSSLRHTMQEDVPVIDQGRLVGMVSRVDLIPALKREEFDVRVSDIVRQIPQPASPAEPLVDVLRRMRNSNLFALPVIDQGRLAGLITREKIGRCPMKC
ncbi:MAG: site-2 protease family protein [Candidatus Alcyoniella australis]|nr:site-2 protease family protein [Candidatus Alcyoniella australis]